MSNEANDPALRPTFDEVLAMRDVDIAELAARCNTIAVMELERLVGVIDGLTLPDNYSAENRHMDACCRAGIKSVIRDRIAEIQGRGPFGPDNAAEQFVATGREIEKNA